ITARTARRWASSDRHSVWRHHVIRLPAFLIAVLGAALLQPVSAQERLPPLVTKGLQALQEQRCRDAFDIWTADWQWPRDTERRQQLMSTCDFLQEVGAALHGYD